MNNAREAYVEANQKGKKIYQGLKAKGQSGHLSSLDGLLKEVEIVSNIDLGVYEIQLKKVVGTYTNNRRNSFSRDFMPLENIESEFSQKWMNLYNHQIDQGISDPIKVIEYMNYYYVIEGNKRVSVLKYLEGVSVRGFVTRIIPKYDDQDEDIINYYAFLEFNSKTGINEIWFSKPSRFFRLLKYLETSFNSDNKDFYKSFLEDVYRPFRSVYKEFESKNSEITTGDAFILFAKLFPLNEEVSREHLRVIMPSLIREIDKLQSKDDINIQVDDKFDEAEKSFFNTLNVFKSNKKLKVGFVYSSNSKVSGWTYSHEIGRQHIEEKLGNQVETYYIENVPENDDESYEMINDFVRTGLDIIFTTSEIFKRSTLRCALENPIINFFNCSESRPYIHLTNYFGRTYEPRYLTGIIAGALTKNNLIGYTASKPSSEVFASINAFALGAKLVNPYAKVMVAWTNEWNNPKKTIGISDELAKLGADIISNKNLLVPRDVTLKYGVYSMLCSIDTNTHKPIEYLAAPIWKWGIFYEKILTSVLSGSFKKITTMYDSKKLVNFWWGLSSNAIDIYYSKEIVPKSTQKLVELMKEMIINDNHHPFTGPIVSNTGAKIVDDGIVMSVEEILSMDFLVDNVSVVEF
jgi:basic membrane lipoprotein Med (substrate-binding protein (PBP1-ABC) superfamily)